MVLQLQMIFDFTDGYLFNLFKKINTQKITVNVFGCMYKKQNRLSENIQIIKFGDTLSWYHTVVSCDVRGVSVRKMTLLCL